ncbi:hypothetical protein MNVI_45760 [Mycobacterium noviomagense]|uniref:Phenyloxazoline synthase MbtB n=1 Tax=Mycobacterium noviomagense TaxID=459858 RepID=A0A7I7PKU8_9MYCO|nr:hypothetical protein MNVI_45760 [Mycobacterium noviomagense]
MALNEINRATGHGQLFDTVFAYENYPIDTAALTGDHSLAITEIRSREYNHYPLTMQATPGKELGFRFEYDTDVFDAATVQTLTERLQRMLVAMTDDPTRALSSLDLLDESERARLDAVGNRAVLSAPAATPVSVPVLFGEWVVGAPGAVAVSSEGYSLTYRELDEASNRLAHMLVRQGAGLGQCVGLLVSRSVEAVVAMLAVLKSGAAYVPIDPGLPAARLGFVLSDAAPVAVITNAELAGRLDGHEVAVVDIDDPAIDAQPGTALPAPGAEAIAYVIYTSGTTGCPRGGGHHGNVTQLLGSLDAGLPVAGCGRSVIRWRLTFRCGRSLCAAARWPGGGGARCGGRCAR